MNLKKGSQNTCEGKAVNAFSKTKRKLDFSEVE